MSQTWFETTMIVEMAFGDAPFAASPTWTDITEWVREPLTVNRGRTSEYSPFAPGSLDLTLDNRDRRFDPAHSAGPYFGDLNPMTPVRVQCIGPRLLGEYNFTSGSGNANTSGAAVFLGGDLYLNDFNAAGDDVSTTLAALSTGDRIVLNSSWSFTISGSTNNGTHWQYTGSATGPVPSNGTRSVWVYDTTYPVFYGFVQGFPQAIGKGYTDATARVKCLDAFRLLSNTPISGNAYIATVLNDDAVHYWPLQETVGNEYRDIVAGRVLESVRGSDEAVDRAAPLGANQSVKLTEQNPAISGTKDFLRFVDTTDQTIDSTLRTVECWMYVADTFVETERYGVPTFPEGQAGVEISFENESGDRVRIFPRETGAPLIPVVNWAVDTVGSLGDVVGPAVTVGWHHVVYTHDGAGTGALYLNGVDVTTGVTGTSPLMGSQIGVVWPVDAESAAAHVAVYDTELSAADVSDHYVAGLTAFGHPIGERTGERAARILDEAGFPTGLRDLSTGDTVVGPYTSGTNALGYLRQLEDVERGLFFIARDGDATFRDRNWQFVRTSQADFGDDVAGGDLLFRDVRPDANSVDNIRNSVSVRWADGTVTRGDAASITAYGVSDDSTGADFIPSSVTADNLARYIVRTRKDPATRIESMTVTPRRDPTNLFPAVLGVELGDLITVSLQPLYVGASTTYTLAVQGIRHTITRRTWETDLYLAPADTNQYFVVGDDPDGKLGATADNRIPY